MQAAAVHNATLDVLVIGAGFAGLCMGKRLRDAGIEDFLIVDKAPQVGGTWYWNSYPGAACDVMSHFYCFSFAPNPEWSRRYSPWNEIQAYAERCAERFGLGPHLQLEREVTEARFDEAAGLWRVHFADGMIMAARHLVDGTGGLHLPLIPDFPGKDRFQGPGWHSSLWRHDVDLVGKRVAVIGAAASAIQIVPQIARQAARVVLFQRTPNYVVPRDDSAYPGWLKAGFRHVPGLLRLYRLFLFLRYEWLVYPIVGSRRAGWQRRLFRRIARRYLERSITDPQLREKLWPDYPIGCKRILISDDFYAALNRDNVQLETAGVHGITPAGIRTTDGHEHEVDVIVYATGFDTQDYFRGKHVTGQGGLPLSQAWADAPTAYEGIMVAGFPNYYLVTGPNSGVGSTSVIFMIEQAARFIVECIRTAGRARLIAPTAAAMQAYDEEVQAALQDTVWATGCRSWYKREDGRITALYPWNGMTWRRRHRRLRLADFEFTPVQRAA